MPPKSLSTVTILTATLLLVAGCGADTGTLEADGSAEAPATHVDLEAVAHSLVNRSAAVEEGEKVLITGSPRDLELLENLAVHVRSVGAHPLIRLWTERVGRRMWDEVPEEFDGQRWEWDWTLAESADVEFAIWGQEDPDLLAHIAEDRFAARAEANEGLEAIQRGIRLVEVGNGLYPTAARAAQLGVERSELERLFWEGITADPAVLRATGDRLRTILESASTVRVTHPNGTDLSVGIAGAQISVSDGTTDPGEGAQLPWTWLPAGEVYLTVEPGSAEGRLVVDIVHFRGETVEGLDLTFSGGRVQSMEAASGFDALQAYYENGPVGRDLLSVIDFGINPGITSQRLVTYMTSGMFTVFLGADSWAGGDLAIPWNLDFHQPGTTIRVDDRVIVEDGVLRL